jgi:hypothetical protein
MDLDSHPVVQQYHALDDITNPTVRHIVVEAMVIHDQYYGVTLDSLIAKQYTSPLEICNIYSEQLARHIKGKLTANPELVMAVANNSTLLLQCLTDFNPQLLSNDLYHELVLKVQDGIIYDLHSYYVYMTEYHMDEIIAYGW